MRRALSVVGWTLLSVVVVFLALCTAGEVRQRVLVHRAKALMVDIQSLQDHKSTWADAQRLMTKWGKWGRYEGSCTAVDCMYEISLPESPSRGDRPSTRWDTIQLFLDGIRLRPRQIRGGLFYLDGMFLVQDGTVRRKGFIIGVDESPFSGAEGELRYGAFIAISEKGSFEGRMPYDNQEADDSNLLVMQHHCTVCTSVAATLWTGRDDRFRSVSHIGFDCIDGWRSCTSLDQLVDMKGDWGPLRGDPRERRRAAPNIAMAGCAVPTAILARDAKQIILVETISASSKGTKDPETQVLRSTALVRVEKVVRGSSTTREGEVARLEVAGSQASEIPQGPLTLLRGQKVVLLISSWNEVQQPHEFVNLQSCEVARWNPATAQNVELGVAMRDPIRRPEPVPLMFDFSRDPMWAGRY